MNTNLLQTYTAEVGVSCTDSLTGALSYGAFLLVLEDALDKLSKNKETAVIALVDIDLFSRFNHNKNSIQGDLVLHSLVDLMCEHLPEVAVVSRYSGDTFIIFIEHITLLEAQSIFEKVRISFQDAYNKELTMSIGLTFFPDFGKNIQMLIQTGLDALTQAKRQGKNKLSIFREASDSTDAEKNPCILVVDDDRLNLKLMESQLLPLGYTVATATSGEDALALIQKIHVDLVMLDIMMPGMSGYEVCRRIKSRETTRLLPVILVTALDDHEARVIGIEAGADDFITKPPNKEELFARTKSLVNVSMLNKQLTNFQNVLYSLTNTVEAKDHYTLGHTQRVATMASEIGRIMGLDNQTQSALRVGGLLHDIGKIGVSEEILNKPGLLTESELLEMHRHPELGYTICFPLKENLGIALDIIRHHHEKLDGSSYPDGLKGDEISLPVRIMTVADMFDALSTDRPYRKAFSTKVSIKILEQEVAVGKLDGKVVGILKKILFAS